MKTFLSILIVLFLISCSGNVRTGGESNDQGSDTKITAEAYLFDARLYHDNKPTSFRWEIYQTDSVIGMAGRAYLGKGAFKGRVTDDSISVYFPNSNEFLYEAVDELLGKEKCLNSTTGISIFDLFYELPDSAFGLIGFEFAVTEDDDRKMFQVKSSECDWHLDLTYRKQSTGWRPEKLEMQNGQNRLKATLRTYKSSSNIPNSKFQVIFPPQATPISL